MFAADYMSKNKFDKLKAKIKEEQIDEHGREFCEKCGRSDYPFQHHHIIYRSELRQGNGSHPETHNRRNVIKLCSILVGNCHDWFHAKKIRREPWVEERNLKELFNKK